VPFNETRDYVKKVVSNTAIYAALLNRQPPVLKPRLGPPIGPRDGATPVNGELP
jgi:soluble lytic murein transglycosylase